MKATLFTTVLLCALCGCSHTVSATAQPTPAAIGDRHQAPTAVLAAAGYTSLPQAVRSRRREDPKPKFGPPPPGYIRITGEPVPNWDPASMVVRAPGPLNWQPLGPRPIQDEFWSGTDDASGRVVSIAVHPTDPSIAYAASASGGVWKTTDQGVTWTPMTDELSVLNHGAVAIDPSNPDTIYAGTGEYTTFSTGDGLFRSTDGGVTWQQIATTADVGSTCSGIIIDPTNSNRIHVAGDIGYVRSPDGGTTWKQKLAGPVSSIAINPDDPNIVFAGRHGDGIYRSLDRGRTWTKLTVGLPTTDINRILVAVAASNPQTVYAAIINGSAGLRGFYKSTDGGDTWIEKTNTPDFPSPQGWYDAFVGVDPTNENIVFCGGVFPSYAVAGVIRTTDGGNTWTDITTGPTAQLHPDQHTIAFGPDGTIWVGNDGGVWISTNGGNDWINRNATLTVTQNYTVALHPTDSSQAMTGTQDNGTVGRFADVLAWPQIISGDGGYLAYDSADPTRRYTTYVYLTIYRVDSGGWADITGPWDNDSRNFIAPLVMDPTHPRWLLGGTNRVWRTKTAAGSANWTAISDTSVAGGSTLNTIAVAPSDSTIIYTGSRNGLVYVTTDDGGTWNNRSTNLPSGEISDIVIDPNDPAHAFVAYYRTSGKRVLETFDYGQNWTSITGLPAGASARALAIDWDATPVGIYVGSGAGIYCSLDGGATWQKDGSEFPNVNVGDLIIDQVNRTITAATYGRGTWRADLPATAVPGDIDGDGHVDITDLGLMLTAFGSCSGDANYNPAADFDGNDCIDIADLGVLLANFGA